jgi:hypothetical protein
MIKKYQKYVNEANGEDADINEQMEQLEHLLGLLFKNSGIEAYDIEADGLNFNMYVMLSKTEKLSNIVKVLDVCKKLHTDVLIQYVVEFDLWETKSGFPLMTINYIIEDEVDDSVIVNEEEK